MIVGRTAAATVGVGALLTAAVGTAVATTAGSTSHTITFVSYQKGTVALGKNSGAVTEVDKTDGGIIGYNLLFEKFTATSGIIDVSFVTKGGIMYLAITPKNGASVTGRVTGGVGAFKNATGTLTGHDLNKADTKTSITITYHH